MCDVGGGFLLAEESLEEQEKRGDCSAPLSQEVRRGLECLWLEQSDSSEDDGEDDEEEVVVESEVLVRPCIRDKEGKERDNGVGDETEGEARVEESSGPKERVGI